MNTPTGNGRAVEPPAEPRRRTVESSSPPGEPRRRTVEPSSPPGEPRRRTVEHPDRPALTRDELVRVVARDVPDGSYVNLGIGLPTMVAAHLDLDSVVLHTENGMLGMGPTTDGDGADPDLINASKQPVTELPGAAYFHHADSFAMMRGGHLDICIMGAFQVSGEGDLANWHTGAPDAIPAVGGAMDLAIGAKNVFVTMSLFTRDGTPKLVPSCTYPLTGRRCVNRVYTEAATFLVGPAGVRVVETFGTTVAALARRLDVPLAGL